ncbi:transmembrane protein, putative (macronuclear) [Tetrahymena thermophila SB210]|uniref:Transmembrane protein, putative n=1 Tax=Tetrahymena thermophila (strain SB210) TaxID=312017 RepID=W7XHX3_TETTS|nr:transmembrane protein, putative [Tetrahymena thermophila SB210]EWS72794.1 transmembrane protein, putative [Tetrahymena thermophila SB210]|eukprot:XP_012654681.1 transmembrane protein, putative [Tetrahymena thermophila SB210]
MVSNDIILHLKQSQQELFFYWFAFSYQYMKFFFIYLLMYCILNANRIKFYQKAICLFLLTAIFGFQESYFLSYY